MKISLRRQHVLYYLVIIVSIIMTAFICTGILRGIFYSQAESDLKEAANLVLNLLPISSIDDEQKIDEFCKTSGKLSEFRITVILPDGLVIGDSQQDVGEMENHKDRPEIIDALSKNDGLSKRYSDTQKRSLLYYAVKIVDPKSNRVLGVLRAAYPVAQLQNVYWEMTLNVFIVAAIALALSLLISISLVRKINKPIYELISAAEDFNLTDKWPRLIIEKPAELALLTKTVSDMASQLQKRLVEITDQRNQINAVFNSMLESLVVVDQDLTILDINPAGCNLLRMEKSVAEGKSVLDAFRNTNLFTFAKQTWDIKRPQETEILYRQPKPVNAVENSGEKGDIEVYLQVHGTVISGQNDQKNRLLLVFNNITRIKQLEMVRKDFVANVSHELKTPITSIKGFVETLLDGALEDQATAKRFLGITIRQTEQLIAILDDLLILSRLEKDEYGIIEKEIVNLKSVALNAIQVCEDSANAKNINIILDCDTPASAPINSVLMEQALVNLLDNAIKYSGADTEIRLTIESDRNYFFIKVSDQGAGIPEQDLPRIFERFYRVDKGRSRDRGGTGLGLSIVKHIVLAHNGEINVSSTLGKGSEFIIILPGDV